MDAPKTLQEAIRHFTSYENCKAFMAALRWPDGKVKCPQCGSDHVVCLEKARLWKCYGKHERPKFSLKTGTIFEDSPPRSGEVALRVVAPGELQERNQQLRDWAGSRRQPEECVAHDAPHPFRAPFWIDRQTALWRSGSR